MDFLPKQITELVESLTTLPGVGRKTAERYAFFLLRSDPHTAQKLSDNLKNIEKGFSLCRECQIYSENEICPICSNPNRENIICVVAEPLDVVAFEEVGGYQGKYHILHGLITPIEGIGPEDLKIHELITRIKKDNPEEIIIALDADMRGEATAVYISTQLKDTDIKISRLAQGLPQGGEIGYTDPETLSRAIRERRDFN